MPEGAKHARNELTARTASHLCAIVSAANRHGAATISESIGRRFASSVDLRIQVVDSSQAATMAARDATRWADVVVAVGGDGTVADVATGIFGTPTALGIVPAGSTNITARSLGIPPNPADAIAVLAGQHALRPIDVGRGEDRIFLHIAGAGFDAELFKAANPAWKRHLGWVAYLPAAASALRLEPSRIHVTVDDDLIVARSSLVLVANGGSAVAPEFRIYPGIAVDDGWLDVLVFTPTTATQIAATLAHAGRQRLDLSPHVIWRRARNVRIEATPPLAVELDGDPRGFTPREFHIVPAGLDVVTPLA